MYVCVCVCVCVYMCVCVCVLLSPMSQSVEQSPRPLPGNQKLHPTRPPGGLKVPPGCPPLRWVLLGMLLALAAWVLARFLEPDCRRGNAMGGSSHLVLRYVIGPPPT